MNKYIHPLEQHYGNKPLQKPHIQSKQTHPFKEILSQFTDVKVSKHARVRLDERNIHISDQEWQQIGTKMHEAKQKGVTDALVMKDDIALVVSTKNNTIVTALNQEEAENKVFTNINGTIVM